MTVPYRADHVGSLLRPIELLEARVHFNAGRITREQLKEVEDASVLKALDLQKQVGLGIFTEGEYRRAGWSSGLREALEGLEPATTPTASRVLREWQGPHGELANTSMRLGGGNVMGAALAAGRVKQVRRIAGEEAAFLKEHAPGPWKITMPGALSVGSQLWRPGVTDQHYASKREFIDQIIAMLQHEVDALIDDGVSYLQLDSLHYVERITDDVVRQRMIEDGEDPDEYLDWLIEVDNAVLDRAQGRGVTVGMHMCRGNNRSAWHAEGSYEQVAEKAFNQLHLDRFLLEYDTERAGGFEPLRFMPKDKVVVLGLISSKEPPLESQDDLRRRIDEAAKYVPFENLAISPQCGFASTALGNLLSWDEQRAKLELVVQTAQKVWG
jgi:5-methyltetrahydropteroyltriglutamate--homocysteine methyltransferase